MFSNLLQYPVHYFTWVFEWTQDFLSITQPVCMDFQHCMEVFHIGQMFFQLGPEICICIIIWTVKKTYDYKLQIPNWPCFSTIQF